MRYCWMLALTARAARGLARTSATTGATAPNKVVFVGAGSFGSAMALVAARAQPDASIKIWARRASGRAACETASGTRGQGEHPTIAH